MQLGSFLDGAKHLPAVTRPVKFTIGAKNAQAQGVPVEVEAVLSYVDEEERAAINVEAADYLSKAYPGKFIPVADQRNEETFRFLALALRDKADPAKPFCAGGVDELRPHLVFAVASYLNDEYQAYIEAEFTKSPTAADVDKMKAEATGK